MIRSRAFWSILAALGVSVVATTTALADAGDMITVAGSGPTGMFAGGFSGDEGPGIKAQLSFPEDVAVDSKGNLFIADEQNHRIRRMDAKTGIITTVAGSGAEGFSGDGGPATSAGLAAPNGVTVDRDGNILIADSLNNRIRKVDVNTKIITTLAGDGSATMLDFPTGVATDSAGNVLIADYNNHRILRIDAKTGAIATIAGKGRADFLGDGGPATNANFNNPYNIAVDSSNNLFIVDRDNHRVRRIDAKTGIITTVAGSGPSGSGKGSFSGDGGPATDATLDVPFGVAVDPAGNLFISDTANRRIRKVDASTGIMTTVAGDGSRNFSDESGPAIEASFFRPIGLAIDASGNLYIADIFTHRAHMVEGVAARHGTSLVQWDLVALASTFGLAGLIAALYMLWRFVTKRPPPVTHDFSRPTP